MLQERSIRFLSYLIFNTGSYRYAFVIIVAYLFHFRNQIGGIKQARTWLQQDGNKDGNFFTVMGRATDALAADMGKSAGNFVRDAVSTIMVVALAPLSAILLVVR